MKHLQSLRPLRAALCAVACGVALAMAPAAAWAEPKTFSPNQQLSTDVYNSLGLTTSELDENDAKDKAPYDASSEGSASTLLAKNDTYVAANGSQANKYCLRSRLNRLDDAKPDLFGRYEDDYGWGIGGWSFWLIGKSAPEVPLSYVESNLSDNKHDVTKSPTNNGFDGIYATSEACDLGSGWDDCVAELRAYGSSSKTTIDGQNVSGAIVIKVMQLDSAGNRTEVATLVPTTNMNQVTVFPDPIGIMSTPGSYDYLEAGYVQERDAYFEVQVADVDNDGVDEIFSYSGAYVDRDGIRYALVDMFDRDGSSGSWNHFVTELDAGRADAYASVQELMDAAAGQDYAYNTQFLKKAPVVTLAGGNLDRKGGEEIAMAVSAPTDHDSPKDAAKCYVYTWDEQSQRLCGIDGLNEEIGGSYLPLFNSAPPAGVSSEAMVSANCTFGTFQVPGTQKTVDALLVAGWDCGNGSNLSKNNRYSNAGYRYVYFDPEQDEFVVSGYLTRALGKDASHIVETATKEADQDERYAPTLAPFALGCARLRGLRQSVENDQVLFGGEIYEFALGSGLSTSTGWSISMCSDQCTDGGAGQGMRRKDKDQVWLGDVAVGNVGGSDNYEESFLAVVGVHRDEDIDDSDDYYWMDVAHFTAKYTGNAAGQDDNASSYSYVTAQEQVIVQGVRRNNQYGTWISLCLPNVSHRGVQVRYQDMAKYYTAPQVLAMLEDAPYFQDLQDSFHYIVLGGSGFERTQGEGKSSGWGIEGQAGIWGSMTGGFLGRVEIEGELSGHGSYESQNARTLEYGVSYESHAGEGNKVVVYTVPLVYYHYKISDPDRPGTWEDLVIPEYQTPSTALVSSDVWDGAADLIGAPKTSDILSNVSGNPDTYSSAAMAGSSDARYGLSVTRAFTSKDTTMTTNSQGGTITQSISTESEAEQQIGYGWGIALKAGGGFGVGRSEALAGLAFEASGGFSNIMSSSRGFGFEGAVDNLPEQAAGYQFSWQLAVNKSHKDMAQDGSRPSDNQFWIVGYEVTGVTRPQAPAVSGLVATGVTDHSVTLSWDAAELPEGYQYGLAMVNDNGQLSDWRLVDREATSFEWGGESDAGHGLDSGHTYKFAVAACKNVTECGIRSPYYAVTTLPQGHKLTVSGLNVTDPANSDRNVHARVGTRVAAQEQATYSITTTAAAGGDASDTAGGADQVAQTTTYVEPRFTWYRKDLRSNDGELVGLGKDVTFGTQTADSLMSQLSSYAGAPFSQTDDPNPHVASFAVPGVSAADDGSVWYCNVSYNDVLVSSQPVYLDVTHTVLNAGEGDFALGRRARLRSLGAGRRAAFSRVYPDAQVTLVEGSSDRSDNPNLEPEPQSPTHENNHTSAGSGGTQRTGSADTTGSNSSEPASDDGSVRSDYGASMGGLAQTGDTMVSGAVICVIAAVAAALISVGWRMRRHHR